jgi:hypothetical protein
MGAHPVIATGPAIAVGRLVVLALTLAGLVAMHGLASVDGAGLHRSALSIAVSPIGPDTPIPVGAHGANDSGPLGHIDGAARSPVDHDGHGGIGSCLGILLSLLTGLGLYALGAGGPARDLLERVLARPVPAIPRAPPRPIFLALCMWRR